MYAEIDLKYKDRQIPDTTNFKLTHQAEDVKTGTTNPKPSIKNKKKQIQFEM